MENNYKIPQSPYDIRDYKIAAAAHLPEKFSLDTPAVKNQGYKPTCVAHALAVVAEYHHNKQHESKEKFSTEFIYGLREDGDYIGDGMCIRHALKNLLKYGDVFERDCPGNHDYQEAMEIVAENKEELMKLAYPHRISAYFRIDTAKELKTALMKHGVVAVSMNTYDSSWLSGDVYKYKEDTQSGRHCVIIYGWNEKGWLVQNSWGIFYGGDGKFILPYDFKLNEMWGIADDVIEDFIKPKRNKWLDIIYKIINKLINMFKK